MNKLNVKTKGLTFSLRLILFVLSSEEENGTSSVAVECADIGRNTSGEGGSLVRN